jgi:hypothetical protein
MTNNEKPSPQAAATWWYSPSASEPPTDLAGWLERIRAHVTWARGAMTPREMPSACASLEKAAAALEQLGKLLESRGLGVTPLDVSEGR